MNQEKEVTNAWNNHGLYVYNEETDTWSRVVEPVEKAVSWIEFNQGEIPFPLFETEARLHFSSDAVDHVLANWQHPSIKETCHIMNVWCLFKSWVMEQFKMDLNQHLSLGLHYFKAQFQAASETIAKQQPLDNNAVVLRWKISRISDTKARPEDFRFYMICPRECSTVQWVITEKFGKEGAARFFAISRAYESALVCKWLIFHKKMRDEHGFELELHPQIGLRFFLGLVANSVVCASSRDKSPVRKNLSESY